MSAKSTSDKKPAAKLTHHVKPHAKAPAVAKPAAPEPIAPMAIVAPLTSLVPPPVAPALPPLSRSATLAPFRVVLRDRGASLDTPWTFFATANTDAQAAAIIRQNNFSVMDVDAEIQPNTPLENSAPVYEVPRETRQLITQLQNENLELRTQNFRFQNQLDERALAHQQAKAAAVAKENLDAITGESPMPFAPGQTVRDLFTGIAVLVTELNPKSKKTGNVRKGFAWRSLTKQPGERDYEGYVPLESTGCYRALRDGETTETASAELKQ